MSNFSFEILHENGRMRVGRINTTHGSFETPAFIPVATKATIKGLTYQEVAQIGYNYLLCNTYHLWSPIYVIENFGGLHNFMNWPHVIITDSGGYQVFSLGARIEHGIGRLNEVYSGISPKRNKKLTEIDDSGVHFIDPKNGEKRFLSPELSIEIQEKLGSDIMFVLDECTSPYHHYDYNIDALERTHRWAQVCLDARRSDNALFGIVQGSIYRDLREQSAKFIGSLPFDGFGIGGVLLYATEEIPNPRMTMYDILDWTVPILPYNKPRHLLGIGDIESIFNCVELGIDTFDCVDPMRIGRRGNLFLTPGNGGNVANKFRLNIRKNESRMDEKPIDPYCQCPTCLNYTRAYLNWLYRNEEIAYQILAVQHNLWFMYRLMEDIRQSIRKGSFAQLKEKWLGYQ